MPKLHTQVCDAKIAVGQVLRSAATCRYEYLVRVLVAGRRTGTWYQVNRTVNLHLADVLDTHLPLSFQRHLNEETFFIKAQSPDVFVFASY